MAVYLVWRACVTEFQSEGFGFTVPIYDRNSDEVLVYTTGADWHEKESKAETEVHGSFDVGA